MKKIILILILALAFVLRFYRLNDYPALNADEAAIGYNAFSLIQTGKDEHGNVWPIHFQSFNDYKPGLYFYIVLPFVKYLGLNAWSVRIPNAILGVFSVLLLYLLTTELFGEEFHNKSPGSNQSGNDNLKIFNLFPLISALFLAVSPWHIHFSRGGWESNTATFLILLGVYLFVKGKDNLLVLMFSALSFSFSLYTYHSARIVAPILVLGLIWIYRSSFKKKLSVLFLAGLVGLVATLPLIKDFSRSDIISRAAGVGLFADIGPIERTNEQRMEHGQGNYIIVRSLHNKLVNYSLTFLKNWFDHFHGLFLFVSGDDIQRDKVPETGEMYLFDVIFIIFDSDFVIKQWGKDSNKDIGWKLIFFWLIIAPIAAALTFQSPHALRAENMVIPLVIISSYGFINILNLVINFKFKTFKYLVLSVLFLIMLWNFLRYLHMYWVHMAKEYPFSSQYGLYELVNYVSGNGDKYKNIVLTDKYDQPYVLFLFYLKYDPAKFQNGHVLTPKDKYGFSTVSNFDKYVFKPINWDKDKLLYRDSLIIGTDSEIPNEANIVNKIYGSNGYLYFKVVVN